MVKKLVVFNFDEEVKSGNTAGLEMYSPLTSHSPLLSSIWKRKWTDPDSEKVFKNDHSQQFWWDKDDMGVVQVSATANYVYIENIVPAHTPTVNTLNLNGVIFYILRSTSSSRAERSTR